MNTPTRVAAFVAGLTAVFAAALGAGSLVGPVGTAAAGSTAAPLDGGSIHAEPGHAEPGHADADEPAAEMPGGLLVAQDGYRLDLADHELPASSSVPLAFRVLGPDGQPVTRYTTEHGEDLHLVVVRRDLSTYQHVHPRLDAGGTWRVPLDLSRPGVHRVFADFTPADRSEGLTLGADVSVAGDHRPRPLPTPNRTAEVDGYTVTLDGAPEPGQESELTLTVSRDGEPVTDLQPYLEAYGHLVALRDRDLAYLHVHPLGHPGDGSTEPGPGITFAATAPSAGAYRLFLDFRHDDQVRTAAFTVDVG
ncbi:hypothetical protein GCM10009616_37420 [Microlunatus lacustris]